MVADRGGARDANPAPSSPREFQRPQVLGQLFRAAGIFEQIKVDLKRRGQQSFRAFAPSETELAPTRVDQDEVRALRDFACTKHGEKQFIIPPIPDAHGEDGYAGQEWRVGLGGELPGELQINVLAGRFLPDPPGHVLGFHSRRVVPVPSCFGSRLNAVAPSVENGIGLRQSPALGQPLPADFKPVAPFESLECLRYRRRRDFRVLRDFNPGDPLARPSKQRMKNLRTGSSENVRIAAFRPLELQLLDQNKRVLCVDVEGSAQIVIGDAPLLQERAGAVGDRSRNDHRHMMPVGELRLFPMPLELPYRLAGVPRVNVAPGFGDECQRKVSYLGSDNRIRPAPPQTSIATVQGPRFDISSRNRSRDTFIRKAADPSPRAPWSWKLLLPGPTPIMPVFSIVDAPFSCGASHSAIMALSGAAGRGVHSIACRLQGPGRPGNQAPMGACACE